MLADSHAECWDISDQPASIMFNERQLPRERRRLHSHPHYELLYIVKGFRDFEVDGRLCRAGAGELALFRPGELHIEFAGSKFISFFVLRFKDDELAKAGIKFPSAKETGSAISLPNKKEFFELFSAMVKESKRNDADSKKILGAYLLVFTVKLRRALAESGKDGESGIRMRLKKAVEILQDKFAIGAELEDVAEAVFMSKSHFSHTFKEQVGESPKRFQIKRRIEEAKRLLLETAMPAADIASRLGYESRYYFYRQFKDETGMTADSFRRSKR